MDSPDGSDSRRRVADEDLALGDFVEEKRSKQSFTFAEIQGDLFTCDKEASLCHCVSVDMAMGKGIAVLFKNKFGKVAELKKQNASVGEGALLSRPEAKNAFVYYLVTKPKYSDKPTLQTLKSSLRWMREHAVRKGVRKIAMPKIGCGLDGLNWDDVKMMIIELFSETDIQIEVYII